MSPPKSDRQRARDRVVFALDVGSLQEAEDYVNLLEGHVGMFKVGKQLFLRTGPRVITWLRERGCEVFLDLKFHDIPQTVARASMEATRLGATMFNVHASGSSEMMRQAVAAVDRVCRTEKIRRPHLLAVTVLTSLSTGDLATIGVSSKVEDQVVRLASLAEEAGMDGVVASPLEIQAIREVCSSRFLVVTPGIRASGDDKGDQARVTAAADAVAMGADYIVVGRPIRDAADPVAAADDIVAQLAKGSGSVPDGT